MSSFILSIASKSLCTKSNQPFNLDYTTNSKFSDDKVHYDGNDVLLLVDGVVVNKKELLSKDDNDSWCDYLIAQYFSHGSQFIKDLRGSFYGFIYDKKKNTFFIFSDHLSTKPIYYTVLDSGVTFGNEYISLVKYLRAKGVRPSLNEKAGYLLLSYGYVFEDITISNEINRLRVGYSAVVRGGDLSFEKFFQLKNDTIAISMEEAIEEVDTRFKLAVKRAFSKDREYGYQHIAGLSGGLDSRMTVYVAHALGFTDQLNFTFSQTNYLDETIAKKIATDLGHNWIFKSLDHGNFLKNVDRVTALSGGNVLFAGLAHGDSLYQMLNFNDFGLVHTGQLGDVVVATFFSTTKRDKGYKFGDGAYSKVLLNKCGDIRFKENYANEEIFKFYIRGFYGANQGLLSLLKHTETYSPFYDIDFMSFCLSLPVEFRYNHKLYKEWIRKKYPKAAGYIWEAERVPVNYKKWIGYRNLRIPLKELPYHICKKFRLPVKNYSLSTKHHMNPMQYWYETNSSLRFFFDTYFRENINILSDYPELKMDCVKLFTEGKGTEKVQAISLLAAAKLLL